LGGFESIPQIIACKNNELEEKMHSVTKELKPTPKSTIQRRMSFFIFCLIALPLFIILSCGESSPAVQSAEPSPSISNKSSKPSPSIPVKSTETTKSRVFLC
jgi:short subunit fatty acids transporter